MLSYDSITEPESSDVMAKRGSGCNPSQWSQAVIILCTGIAGLTEPIHGDAEPVFNDWSRYQYVSAESRTKQRCSSGYTEYKYSVGRMCYHSKVPRSLKNCAFRTD